MPEVTADAPDLTPETTERRQFAAENIGDSLYVSDAAADETSGASSPLGSSLSAGANLEAAPAVAKSIEAGDRFVNQEEDPFDDYRTPGDIQDFGPLTKEVADRLDADHIVILHGSENRLSDLAFSVACLHFSSWIQKSFNPSPRTNYERQQDVMTIDNLIKSPFLINQKGNKLLVVLDLGYPNLTPLVPQDYSDPRGRRLLADLKGCEDLRVLVLTLSTTWDKLMKSNGTGVMSTVAKKIDLAPRTDGLAADHGSIGGRINDILSNYGKPGFLTLWCIAWLPTASLDDIVFTLEIILRYWRRKADDLVDFLEQWRMAWPSILSKLGARQVDRSQSVSIEMPSASWSDEVRRLLRIDFRMLHLEALDLMRQSGVLLRAKPELLQVFAMSMARLAREERQLGRSILVHLIEDWLQNAPDERASYLLTGVFCAIVRDDETAFASDALAQLPGNGYPDAAAAILFRCPPRFIMQPWFITLYKRILPSLTAAVRLEIWSRLIRISAVSAPSIGETVVLARSKLSNDLFVEFVARFVEELLLGDRERAVRLLALLQDGQADPGAPGALIFNSIRSKEFREYADRRANKWAPRNERNALFDTWIIRTLIPIVPSVSPKNVIHLFGQALYDVEALPTPHGTRASSPADQVVAMLLVEYGSATDSGPNWALAMIAVLDAVICDRDGAIATYDTLRSLAERFYRVPRVLAVVSPNETSIELSARAAIRGFFDKKSEIVDRLRRVIEAKYFEGA